MKAVRNAQHPARGRTKESEREGEEDARGGEHVQGGLRSADALPDAMPRTISGVCVVISSVDMSPAAAKAHSNFARGGVWPMACVGR